jgi:hypothetical protein
MDPLQPLDTTDLANVSVSIDGTAIIDLNAPSVQPVAVPDAPPAGQRIEDVVASMQRTEEPEAPAAEEPAPTEEPEAPVANPLTVQLPPREPNGAPVEVTVETQEQADALRRLHNGYARREDVRSLQEELQKREAAIEAVTMRFTEDPTGFLIENMPQDKQLAVAKVLVARLAEEHAQDFDVLLSDTVARREALLESREQREEWARKSAEERAVAEYRNNVLSAVESLIPDGISDEDADEFVRDSGAYLAAVARAGGAVDPEAVPSLLASKVRRYGFDRASAAAANASGSRDAGKAPASPPPPPAAPTGKPAVQLTPELMRARTAALAVTPQGAGAVPATVAKPPAGLRIEEAAAWYRQRAATAS